MFSYNPLISVEIPAAPPRMPTLLNGFEVKLTASSFKAFVSDMPTPESLREMREREAGEWFFHWRDGKLYALPEVKTPQRRYGTETVLEISDHRHLGLLAARINHQLPAKFPEYEALHRRPFAFLGKRA